MEALRVFLGEMKQKGIARGNLLGLLNVLVGRRLQKAGGGLISTGCSWRSLAGYLKLVRWDKQAVRELGIDPATLHPRDRVRYWFQAMSQTALDSQEANQAGDRLAAVLAKAGYVVGPGPKVSAS
jgi:hypothetical protein